MAFVALQMTVGWGASKTLPDRVPISYGGSIPPGCQGWQRRIRQTPFQAPISGPYLRTAPMKYSLHVG